MVNNQVLYAAVDRVFTQLSELLERIDPREYARPQFQLLNASIGQHVRHLLEIFTELNRGYVSGVVNYELRERDTRLEHDPGFAHSRLAALRQQIAREPRTMLLEAFLQADDGSRVQMETHYLRELAYALDHAIHHMALIRIGLLENCRALVDESFGVAFATQQYRNACAQ